MWESPEYVETNVASYSQPDDLKLHERSSRQKSEPPAHPQMTVKEENILGKPAD